MALGHTSALTPVQFREQLSDKYHRARKGCMSRTSRIVAVRVVTVAQSRYTNICSHLGETSLLRKGVKEPESNRARGIVAVSLYQR